MSSKSVVLPAFPWGLPPPRPSQAVSSVPDTDQHITQYLPAHRARGNDHFLGVFGDNVYKAASGIQGQRERVQGYMPRKIKSWHPRVTGASWRSDPLKQGTDPSAKHRHVQVEKQWLSMGMSASPGLLGGLESFPGFSSLHQQNGCQPSGW